MELCSGCLAEIGLFDGISLPDGSKLCKYCFDKLPPHTQKNFSELNKNNYEDCLKFWNNRFKTMYPEFHPDFREGGVFESDSKTRTWRCPVKNKQSEIFKYEEITDFSYSENGEEYKKSGIGRAIVGGVVAGGIGAIVGGTTGTSHKMIDEMYITIYLNNPWIKNLKIFLINGRVKTSSALYSNAKQSADRILSQLKIIHDDVENKDSKVQIPTDQLIELKKLLDLGIISESEFFAKKKQLLGL